MVSVSTSVNLPLHHKVHKFSSGTGLPGWSRKKGRKTVVVVVVTRVTLASAGISCRRMSVCLSVHLSQVGVLLISTETAKRRITQTTPHKNLGKTQMESPPTEAPNAGGYRLNAGAVAENWRLSTRSVVNLARFSTLSVHVICLQHVRRDAARRAGLSATANPSYV